MMTEAPGTCQWNSESAAHPLEKQKEDDLESIVFVGVM
jgi:hypothetical protein